MASTFIAIVSDAGGGTSAETASGKTIGLLSPAITYFFDLGDHYPDASTATMKNMDTSYYNQGISKAAAIAVPGNHDNGDSGDSGRPSSAAWKAYYAGGLTNTTGPGIGSDPGGYPNTDQFMDIAGWRFFFIQSGGEDGGNGTPGWPDTNDGTFSATNARVEWLRANWAPGLGNVVCTHHLPYSAWGDHHDNASMDNLLAECLGTNDSSGQHAVALIGGHDHNMQIYNPITQDKAGNAITGGGPGMVEMVLGGCGSGNYVGAGGAGNTQVSALQFLNDNTNGFTLLEIVSPTELKFSIMTSAGAAMANHGSTPNGSNQVIISIASSSGSGNATGSVNFTGVAAGTVSGGSTRVTAGRQLPGGLIVPATGVFYGDDTATTFAQVENELGRTCAIHRRHYGSGWQNDGSTNWPWPASGVESGDAAERSPRVMPFITVAATETGKTGFPVCTQGGTNGTFTNDGVVNGFQGLDRVTNGEFDAAFTAAFQEIAAIPGPVWVNLWQEPNIPAMGGYYQWQAKSGDSKATAMGRYISAWQAVVNLARAAGATNAIFVWAPTAFIPSGDTTTDALNTYPGDDYVDVIGCDRYRNLLTATQFAYDFAVAHNKPFIIAETGVNPTAGGGQSLSGPATLADDLTRMKSTAWIELIGYVTWENTNTTGSTADSLSANLTAYQTLVNDPWMTQFYTGIPSIPTATGSITFTGLGAGLSSGGGGSLPAETPTTAAPQFTGGDVYKATVIGSDVYVGGVFTAAGSSSIANLAAYDKTTYAVKTWNPGADGSVFKIIPGPAGKVFVCGGFANVGGKARPGVALIQDVTAGASPVADATFSPPSINQPVYGMAYDPTALSGQGALYIAGDFTSIGGTAVTYFSCLNATTGALQPWNPVITNVNNNYHPGRRVMLGKHASDQSSVYICGAFGTVNGTAMLGIACLDKNPASATPALASWRPDVMGTVLGSDSGTQGHDIDIKPDGTQIIAGFSGGGTGQDGNHGVNWTLVESGVLNRQNTRNWTASEQAGADTGDHNSCGADDSFAFFGHHGNGGTPNPQGLGNPKIYGLNWDGTPSLWIQQNVSGAQGVYTIELDSDRMIIGGDLTAPEVGLIEYARTGGVSIESGIGSGQVTFTGNGDGVVTAVTSATGVVIVTGLARGDATEHGSGAGAVAFTGAAVGTANNVAVAGWLKITSNGGRGNAIAADPNTPGRACAVGDVFGHHTTTDGAHTWVARLEGVPVKTLGTIAGGCYGRTAVWSLKHPGVVYIGTGTLTGGGGHTSKVDLTSGTPYTQQALVGSVPFGTNPPSTLPDGVSSPGTPTPRPGCGQLMDVYYTGSGAEYLFCATSSGVTMFTDEASASLIFSGDFDGSSASGFKIWKALIVHVESGQPVIYAATYGLAGYTSTLYRITGALTGTISTTVITGVPAQINDFSIVGGILYACGGANIYKVTNAGATWTAIDGGITSGHIVSSLDSVLDSTGTITTIAAGMGDQVNLNKIVIGSFNNNNGVWTWAWVPESAYHPFNYNDGSAYWLATGTDSFEKNTFMCSGIRFDANGEKLYISGTQGMHVTDDLGVSVYPAGYGFGGGENSNMTVTGVGNFAASDVDETGISTANNWKTYVEAAAQTTPNSLSFTTASGDVYVLNGTTPATITKNGVDFSSPYFQGACVSPSGIAVDAAGNVSVALYGGGILLFTPLAATSATATGAVTFTGHATGHITGEGHATGTIAVTGLVFPVLVTVNGTGAGTIAVTGNARGATFTHGGTVGWVQTAGQIVSGTSASTLAVPLTGNAVQVGNMLTVALNSEGTQTITSVTDDVGNTYELDVNSGSHFAGSASTYVRVATTIVAVKPSTVTVNISANSQQWCITIDEWSGVVASGTRVDTGDISYGANSNATPTASSGTDTLGNELFIAFTGWYLPGTTLTSTVTSPFTEVSQKRKSSGQYSAVMVAQYLESGQNETTTFNATLSQAPTFWATSLVPYFTASVGTWNGSASGSVGFVGAAAGTVFQKGVASSAVAFTGHAVGTVYQKGVASGSVAFTGVTPGEIAQRGVAAMQVTITNAAQGIAISHAGSGIASGTVAVTGAATGHITQRGAATGSVAVAGAGVGQAIKKGTAASTITVTGTAAGTITLHVFLGTAAGLVAVTGTGVGHITQHGAATGSVSFVGAAAGRPIKRGSGAGSVAFTGAGGGSTSIHTVTGTAAGVIGVVGAATGHILEHGTAAGSVAVTGMAHSIAGNTVGGSGIGPIIIVGAATGTITHHLFLGSGTGSITVTGVATSQAIQKGTAPGSVSFVGSAFGRSTVKGSGQSGVTVTGFGTGIASTHQNTATATGHVTFSGAGTGIAIKHGSGSGSITFTGAGAGTITHHLFHGAATGNVSFTGSAGTHRIFLGSGASRVSFSGNAVGTVKVFGSGAGNVNITGRAAGFNMVSGAASLDGFVSIFAAPSTSNGNLDSGAVSMIAIGSMTVRGQKVVRPAWIINLTDDVLALDSHVFMESGGVVLVSFSELAAQPGALARLQAMFDQGQVAWYKL